MSDRAHPDQKPRSAASDLFLLLLSKVHFTVITLTYLGRQAGANSVDSDKKLQNAASEQCLHCLPLIRQFLHTSVDTCSKMDLFKSEDQHGKVSQYLLYVTL